MNLLKKNPAVAQKPPMGWNSWDCFAANVTEEQLMANARYVRDNMKQCGWEYIVCDIQWSEPLAGTEEGEYRPFAALCLDEYGRQIPAENRFPSSAGGKGFKPIADEIHAMSLKFGIHIMRGIPRQGGARAHACARHECDRRADRQSLLHLRVEQRHVRRGRLQARRAGVL